MSLGHDHPLQSAVLELLPSAAFAASVAFATSVATAQPIELGAPVAAAGAAFFIALAVLRRVGRTVLRFELPEFETVPQPDAGRPDHDFESGDRDRGSASDLDELLLDDVLADLGPGSRVVRLFQPESIPTAGELKLQIDHHLAAGQDPRLAPDARRELTDAIEALRRSMR